MLSLSLLSSALAVFAVVEKELFRLFRSRPDVYGSRRSAAEVALVYSRTTFDYVGGAEPDLNYLDGFRGAYNALMDGRLPFDLSLGNVRNVPVGDDTGLLDPAISVSDREENRLANRLLAMA